MTDFWARRKAAVQAEEDHDAALEQAAAQAEKEAALAEKTDEDILAELELPDPDTLEQGDDFKVFLADAVPARIRTRALRRLWRLNPILANVDGLVDYGEDFTDAACVVENLQTAYQVGKGMTKHVLEMARQAEAEAAAEKAGDPAAEECGEDDAAVAAVGDDALSVDAPSAQETHEAATLAPAYVAPEPGYDALPDAHTAPRAQPRMRFAFDAPTQGTAT